MKPRYNLALLGAALALIAGAATAAPFAYVPNEKSGTISIIDTGTDQVLGELREVAVTLRDCAEVEILGDRHRLRQLLLNLADNAVKYNVPGGKVSLSLVCDPRSVDVNVHWVVVTRSARKQGQHRAVYRGQSKVRQAFADFDADVRNYLDGHPHHR